MVEEGGGGKKGEGDGKELQDEFFFSFLKVSFFQISVRLEM